MPRALNYFELLNWAAGTWRGRVLIPGPTSGAGWSAINCTTWSAENWRRGRDSNPRYGCPYAAFRVRCIRPLCHLSKTLNIFAFCGGAASLKPRFANLFANGIFSSAVLAPAATPRQRAFRRGNGAATAAISCEAEFFAGAVAAPGAARRRRAPRHPLACPAARANTDRA